MMGGKGSGKHGKQGRKVLSENKKKKRISIRLYPETIEKLKQQKTPFAQIIDEAIEDWIKKHGV